MKYGEALVKRSPYHAHNLEYDEIKDIIKKATQHTISQDAKVKLEDDLYTFLRSEMERVCIQLVAKLILRLNCSSTQRAVKSRDELSIVKKQSLPFAHERSRRIVNM